MNPVLELSFWKNLFESRSSARIKKGSHENVVAPPAFGGAGEVCATTKPVEGHDLPRIISLIASSTEIVCALGFEDQLVGRSHECDFPESVKKLPVCTAPKFQLDGSSYEIDQRVKAILQEGLSVYRVEAGKLNELRPEVIITQTQCEVCAVSRREVEAAVCELMDSRPKIVSLEILAEIFHA